MERVGRYVLMEPLAAGGMAEVFRGAALGTAGFARLVAIKRMKPLFLDDTDAVGLFLDEARTASALSHQNIVQVIDLGQFKNTYFLVMEHVAGQPFHTVLRSLRKKGMQLPQGMTLYIISQLLGALTYAHERTTPSGAPMKIIHRDVSPQNVLVGYDGRVMLADFGIARAAERVTQTRAGNIRGKPRYISPEQVAHDEYDQRADLYSVGVVMHEALSLLPMRPGTNPIEQLQLAQTGTYSRFEDLEVDVPKEIASLVYRALTVNPAGRWPDARTFRRAVEQVAKERGFNDAAPQLAAFMQMVFPAEIEEEEQTLQRCERRARQLAALPDVQVPDVLVGSGVFAALPQPGPEALHPLPPPGAAKAKPTSLARLAAAFGGRGRLVAAGAGVALAAVIGVVAMQEPAAPPLGQMLVSTEPPGAMVFLGDKQVCVASPCLVDGLAPGLVELEVRLAGHETARKIVSLEAGGVETVQVALAPSLVTTSVRSEPAGARVLLDGVLVGQTPVDVRLALGRQTSLRLELDGHTPLVHAVAPSGPLPALAFALVPLAPAGPPAPAAAERKATSRRMGEGLLTMQSKPWARIFIDGKDTGRYTPVMNMKLSAGPHVVRLVNDESRAETTFTVDIRANATTTVQRDL